MCVCIFVYVCVCVCWHDSPRSAPLPAPVAHIEGDFNTPTCLGRDSDTALFPYNGVQTEGAGGRGRGLADKRRSGRSRLVSFQPAASRRRCSTQGLRRKEKRRKRKGEEGRKDVTEEGWGGFGLVWWSEDGLDRTGKGQKGPNLPYLWCGCKRNNNYKTDTGKFQPLFILFIKPVII